MNDTLLSLDDLQVIYASNDAVVHAVNGISFDVMPRETIGLVGETGAGKTTTALSILRLLPERTGRVQKGKIFFKGEDLLEKSEKEMRLMRGACISMIFQDPMTALNPILSVGDQIRESLEIHYPEKTKAQQDERVDELMQMVGIPASRKSNYPHEFSGGMKQRVVIAMSLACNPELIIADEPTTALDVTIQAQVLAMIKELKERLNTSMIMITHDLGIVARTCDKVAIMYAGEIVEQGTVRDIFLNENHHPYTVGLFGSIPDLERETARLTPIDGLMPDPVALPSGCKFHPRCGQCMEICKTETPKPRRDGTHQIACHLFHGGTL
jgi:peptide/nickel transport system ATP-binding protein